MTQTFIALVGLCGAAVAAAQAQYADAQARELLDKGRSAVASGGPSQPIRSLILKGRLRVPDREPTADGTVAIKILLPDRFLRVDDLGGTVRRSLVAARPGTRDTNEQRTARAQFTTLMLGALSLLPNDQRLTVRSTGEQGFEDTIALDVSGPSYSVRVVFDASSRLPLRVVSFGEQSTSTVVSFANRRAVGGHELPFRVTTQTPDRVLETLMFDEILVNPELREGDFR